MITPRRQASRIVVGIGNRDRGDDAVGPIVCDRVRLRAPHLDTWVVEADPSSLVVTWRPDDEVVLVDAVVTGAPPGTVHRLDPGTLATGHLLSTHGVGIADTIRLSELLHSLPTRLWILGVEAVSFEMGAPLSVAVARVIDTVATTAIALLDDRPAAEPA